MESEKLIRIVGNYNIMFDEWTQTYNIKFRYTNLLVYEGFETVQNAEHYIIEILTSK